MRMYACLAISVLLALYPSHADAQSAGVDVEVGAGGWT